MTRCDWCGRFVGKADAVVTRWLVRVGDHELGVRLVSMPAVAADDAELAARWLRWGTLDGARDMVQP